MSGMSVQEAATHLGIHEKTVRRRIKEGKIPALRVDLPQGYEWRVYPDGLPEDAQVNDHMDSSEEEVSAQVDDQVSTGEAIPDSAAIIEVLRINEKLQEENRNLAAQLGFVSGQLFEARDRIALLMAPKDEPAPEPAASTEPKVSWWRRLLG